MREVTKVSFYVDELGLLQHNDQLEGIFIHGVSPEYDKRKFKSQIVQGRFLNPKEKYEILLSSYLCQRLDVNLNDTIIFHKLDPERGSPRTKLLHVVGIYETNIEDVDKKKALSNMSFTQHMQRWSGDQIEGVQVNWKDPDDIALAEKRINEFAEFDLVVYPVYDKYFALFDWLHIISNNVSFLIVIIVIITTINTCSIALVIIMERSSMIGILRALGGSVGFVQAVFFDVVRIIGLRGLILGNVIAIGLCFIQSYIQIIPLDPQNYYMDYVPVKLDVLTVLVINVLTFTGYCIVAYLPILVISGIKPVKTIRFH
jgi:lipoprotein-releasing system permease protein